MNHREGLGGDGGGVGGSHRAHLVANDWRHGNVGFAVVSVIARFRTLKASWCPAFCNASQRLHCPHPSQTSKEVFLEC